MEYVDVLSAVPGANGMPRPELYVADCLHLTPASYAPGTDLLRLHPR